MRARLIHKIRPSWVTGDTVCHAKISQMDDMSPYAVTAKWNVSNVWRNVTCSKCLKRRKQYEKQLRKERL